MGAMITQVPDRFRAVVSLVGIYDMLRVELSANGAFNIPEYGTVKDEAQFRALLAYSPYHNVEDGRDYPAVLFMTGANDPRVDPLQSRKMTARLQAALGIGTPGNPLELEVMGLASSSGTGGTAVVDVSDVGVTDVDNVPVLQVGADGTTAASSSPPPAIRDYQPNFEPKRSATTPSLFHIRQLDIEHYDVAITLDHPNAEPPQPSSSGKRSSSSISHWPLRSTTGRLRAK